MAFGHFKLVSKSYFVQICLLSLIAHPTSDLAIFERGCQEATIPPIIPNRTKHPMRSRKYLKFRSALCLSILAYMHPSKMVFTYFNNLTCVLIWLCKYRFILAKITFCFHSLYIVAYEVLDINLTLYVRFSSYPQSYS